MTPSDWDRPEIRRGIERMLSARAEHLAGGERPLGWKLGFGAPASLEKFGLSGPLLGFLTDATVHDPGATVSCEGWAHPVAEPEIAVYLDADVDPEAGSVAGAIGGLGAAIELADVHSPPDDLAATLAGNVFHRAVVLGFADFGRAGAVREDLRGRVVHDGEEVADTTDVEAITGDLVDIIGHAAALLGAAGERLSAGDVIIAGSIIPPLPIRPGEEIVFELMPLPAISVRV